MKGKSPTVQLIHHDFHDPVYTKEELANFQVELARIKKNIQILEDQLAVEKNKLKGLQHLLK